MNLDDELLSLVAAERSEVPTREASARGLQELQQMLDASLPGLPIAHGPLKLGFSQG